MHEWMNELMNDTAYGVLAVGRSDSQGLALFLLWQTG